MYSDFRLEWFIPDNNYVANFLSMNEDLFSTGTDCSVASRAAACGRAQLRALTLGGAVWDAFRENANCGDPVG